MTLMYAVQHTVQCVGQLAGSLLLAYYVTRGKLTTGEFVMFGVYLDQLYRPLDLFATHYRC